MNLKTYFRIMGRGSKGQLAKDLGVEPLTVTRWIRGTSLPGLERRIEIYKATDKHVDSWPDWTGPKAKVLRQVLKGTVSK